jgi:hypothetical protein
MRAFYPGTDSVNVLLETSKGLKALTVPWAATFVGSGNTTASFIAETCGVQTSAGLASKREVESRADEIAKSITRKKGVVRPDDQGPIRSASSKKSLAAPTNNVQPNRMSSTSSSSPS